MKGMWIALFTAAVIAAALVAIAAGFDGDEGSSNVPAFSAEELASLPREHWATNGGSTFNQRYSPLDQIDAANVDQLKGIWHLHLKSGLGGKYSGEAQPIVYNGVIYIVTGADDVFAIDARSGERKWVYKANLAKKISTVCCGWTSRGVAVGDNKVYVGQLDGRLVALDHETGEVAWSTQVARWQDGYTITSAPLYYDGRVYTGLSGGEFGIRGRLTAFDAETGKEVWRRYTIPGPGEVGHDTWPRDNDAWKHGGAPVWQTPAVDPELGLLYLSTGNASPDVDGRNRAGDNLFTASILALDAKTGEYRWHFQEVHHDVWDYDAPNPVVLFDVTVDGRPRHGLAQAGKTGWLYLLDRETGKPLYGIDEKPVPQNTVQHTSKTQPFPSSLPFVPHEVTAAQLRDIRQQVTSAFPQGKAPKIVTAPIYSPPSRSTLPVSAPSAAGGANWPPTSYNRETQMFYVCGLVTAAGAVYGRQTQFSEDPKPGQLNLGSIPVATGFGASPGILSALDARSGRIVWQQRWPDSCYSGSTTTAGNLVFVGRNTGQLQAYDARSGERLWSFQTGAGANSTASIFSLDNQEVVALYAAGNSLAGSAHGDDLWLFGLDGTLGPVAAGDSTGAGEHAGAAAIPPPARQGRAEARTIRVEAGELYFKLSAKSAPRGTVTFVVKNAGSVTHDFAINGKKTRLLQAGQTARLAVKFPKAGKFPYLCTVPGHAAAGMKGTLTIR
jgi:quinohemoprotein ethanol dehydrogenase